MKKNIDVVAVIAVKKPKSCYECPLLGYHDELQTKLSCSVNPDDDRQYIEEIPDFCLMLTPKQLIKKMNLEHMHGFGFD